MIRLGETVDDKRTIAFPLMTESDPLVGLEDHVFTLGQVLVEVPGQASAPVALSRIFQRSIKHGSYNIVLNDAQVVAAGEVYVYVDVPGAQPITITSTIFDPADFADSGSPPPGSSTVLPAGPVTLAGLIDIVRERGDYLSSKTFTDAYIAREIQAAWAELYELMEDQNEGWWDKDGNVTAMPGTRFVALPSDCWRVKGVDVPQGTGWRAIRQVPMSARNQRTQQPGPPVEYRISMRGLELFPVPTVDQIVRVTYAPIVPLLSDEIYIQLYGWEEYIITGALLRLDQREEKPLGERQQELERCKQRVLRASSHRREAEPELLTLHDDCGEDWYS